MPRVDGTPGTPRPTPEQIAAAQDATVPDLIRPSLKILFCGINPSLYSAAVGQHFARPGNRFWPTLHAAGFTPRRLLPSEGQELLALGFGITNVVARATATAAELSPEEFAQGGRLLAEVVARVQPAAVAVLGITAYRAAFRLRHAVAGKQPDRIGGAETWVLPNPSGLNAHYQAGDLARVYRELRQATENPR